MNKILLLFFLISYIAALTEKKIRMFPEIESKCLKFDSKPTLEVYFKSEGSGFTKEIQFIGIIIYKKINFCANQKSDSQRHSLLYRLIEFAVVTNHIHIQLFSFLNNLLKRCAAVGDGSQPLPARAHSLFSVRNCMRALGRPPAR